MLVKDDQSVAQYYFIARSAHIERLRHMDDNTWFFYTRKSYDFDETAAASNSRCVQITPRELPKVLRRAKVKVLEVNEPLMLAAWRVIPWLVLCRVWRLGRTKLVFYALENLDPGPYLAMKLRSSRLIAEGVLRAVTITYFLFCSRICFGTESARNLYSQVLGPWWKLVHTRTTLIEHIPAAEASLGVVKKRFSFVFLGEFSERKGLLLLMDAWDIASSEYQGLGLTLLGKGPMVDSVKVWAESRENVTLHIDPSRGLIASQLDSSESLVLLSQSIGGWKEQVGLPLVEGWARGCQIISSDASGLSATLGEYGHVVIPESAPASVVAECMIKAASNPRPADEILRELPSVSGRDAAKEWLHQ